MKTTKQFLTLALAAAFLTAGFSAGATSLSFTSAEWVVGNQWDFQDIDTNNGSWDAQPATNRVEQFWDPIPDGDPRRTHNVPDNGGPDGDGEFYHTPLGGELIYSPNVDVFELDPWEGIGTLDQFSPSGAPDLNFAALVEFSVASDFPPWQDFVDSRGDLPGSANTEWTIDARNRPEYSGEPDFDNNEQDGFADPDTRLMAQNWRFPISFSFDSINADWEWEAEGSQQINGSWFEVDEHDDTWAQIRFGTNAQGDANRGYMFLASNLENIDAAGGDLTNPVGNWDQFETSNDEDYYHIGATGVSANVGVNVVPEPASMTLLGLGLAGFVTRRFMSRKKKA